MCMELNPTLARQALDEALARFPEFAPFGARLVVRPLQRGSAYMLEYESRPPAELANAWEFQNVAVKTYRRLAGV
ncbi:MAG: hypothetical protein IT163_10415 [Bryobacterales bacterium]|nr:hypothetical protein [Bryobacterales bacterium]